MITTTNRLKFARRALKDASDSLARHDFTKAALAIEFARGMLDGAEEPRPKLSRMSPYYAAHVTGQVVTERKG